MIRFLSGIVVSGLVVLAVAAGFVVLVVLIANHL